MPFFETTPPMANDAFETLDALLLHRRAALAAWQVNAMFLGALASGATGLGPENFLSCISGEHHAKWLSSESAQALLDATTALWCELAETAHQRVHLSRFPVPDLPAIEHVRELAKRRTEELRWFSRGMAAGGLASAETDARGEDLVRSLGEARGHLQFYIDSPERTLFDESAVRARRHSVEIVGALTRAVEIIMRDLLEAARGARLQRQQSR